MLVKVHNLNVHPYQEEFRGVLVQIPANSFIEMDEDEADYFMQKFTFPKKDSQGRPDPVYFKKLKMERPPAKEDQFVCHANGKKFSSQEDLAKALGEFSHMLASRDDVSDEALKKQNASLKKENQKLKTRLDRIEEKLGFSEQTDEASI